MELSVNGLDRSCVLYERLLVMNGDRPDFVHWQANGRGVDLNHNYDAGFAAYKRLEAEADIPEGAPGKYSGRYPESEPETKALADLVRTIVPAFLMTLHSQGEEIYASPAAAAYASVLCRLSGYRLEKPTGTAAYGGLTDWAGSVCGIPAVTVECGLGENPLPLSAFLPTYERLRRMLFTAAAM